jgi:hypothetical protein
MLPALTPEEWGAMRISPDRTSRFHAHRVDFNDGLVVNGAWIDPCRALAALALYGQPFGFTHEDVVLLRSSSWDVEEGGEALRMLASRIKALLPPEKE